jgi:hypothetical protein
MSAPAVPEDCAFWDGTTQWVLGVFCSVAVCVRYRSFAWQNPSTLRNDLLSGVLFLHRCGHCTQIHSAQKRYTEKKVVAYTTYVWGFMQAMWTDIYSTSQKFRHTYSFKKMFLFGLFPTL